MRQEFGERLIDEFCRYAPHFRDAIIDWTLLTPEDIEDRIGLTDGNIQGLYLCGVGTHPGGEVTGTPGHNAAHVVLERLGR